jgi:hypothetical protein
MRTLLFTVSLAAVFAFTGCKGNCQQLSERLCDCAVNSNDKNLCLQNASARASNVVPTTTDEATCQALLKTCDCRLVDTPSGKANCGLARALAVEADAGQ